MSKTKINFEVNQAIVQSIFSHFNLGPDLKKFNFPVLVVQGKQDLLTLSEIKPGFAEMPQVSFTEIDRAGHWVFVEQTDIFNRMVIDFFIR